MYCGGGSLGVLSFGASEAFGDLAPTFGGAGDAFTSVGVSSAAAAGLAAPALAFLGSGVIGKLIGG